ncbi:MAG: hypothetical protein CG442_1592, partial [Methylococcaceae bacterium NSO1]
PAGIAGAEDRKATPAYMDVFKLAISIALDTRFPAGITNYLRICV